jgi:3-dehydroquinate synthase
MEIIDVSLNVNPYSIIVGTENLEEIGHHLRKLDLGQDAVIVTHPCLNNLYGQKLCQSLHDNDFSTHIIEVAEGETSKSAQTAMEVLEQIARYDVFKKVFIIAFGGGVVGDLAGFVAAVYKRGIPYVQVPTTFLAPN